VTRLDFCNASTNINLNDVNANNTNRTNINNRTNNFQSNYTTPDFSQPQPTSTQKHILQEEPLKRPRILLLVCIAFAVAIFLPGLRQVAQAQANNDGAPGYCVSNGGVVDDRQPYFNTNDIEQNWLLLDGSSKFCHFTSPTNGSRIYVQLSTLYADKPSLAALAYYAQVPLRSGCTGNPGSCYCSQLGGSDLFGGINANGGAWVDKSDPVFTVLEACIFPDMSSIDSWGLLYHAYGIIRGGTDLSTVMRFKKP
jgi:hypothetical protein